MELFFLPPKCVSPQPFILFKHAANHLPAYIKIPEVWSIRKSHECYSMSIFWMVYLQWHNPNSHHYLFSHCFLQLPSSCISYSISTTPTSQWESVLSVNQILPKLCNGTCNKNNIQHIIKPEKILHNLTPTHLPTSISFYQSLLHFWCSEYAASLALSLIFNQLCTCCSFFLKVLPWLFVKLPDFLLFLS